MTTVTRARSDAKPRTSVDLSALEGLAGFLLRRAQLVVFRDLIDRMGEYEFRPALFTALSVIVDNPGLRQSRVATAISVKRANMVELVNELERRKLVERVVAPEDRRSYRLYATPAGVRMLKKLRQIIDGQEAKIVQSIGASGKRELLKSLGKLIAALD